MDAKAPALQFERRCFLLVISKKLVTVFLLAQAIHIKESVAGKLHSLLAGICDTRSKRG